LDELVLAIEYQLAEAALAVGLDRRHVEIGGVVAVGIACNEGAVDAGTVLVALLVDVQIAEACIQQPVVGTLAVLLHVALERAHAVVEGEGDAHDAQRVLDQLTVGTLEALGPHGLRRCGAELAIENSAEGWQALEGQRLLEERPAALVEALLVELGGRSPRDD